jgi:hypothetical protein
VLAHNQCVDTPEAMLVCFGASDEQTLDIFAVADELWRRGW